jgi:hypothetical protein
MLPGSEACANDRVVRKATIPFFVAHLIPLLVFVTGVTTRAVVIGVVLYLSRTFFITAGYHRYFSHRSYRLARGRSGGPRTTAPTIATPTASVIRIRRSAASGGATSAGC